MLTESEISDLQALGHEAEKAAMGGQYEVAISKISILIQQFLKEATLGSAATLIATRAEWRRQANDRAGSIDDFRLAAEGFRENLVGDLSMGDRETRAQLRMVLGNLGDMLRDDGQDGDALAVYEEMASVAKSIGELHWQQRALNNVAGILHRAGRLEEALNTYRVQGDLARRIDDPMDLVRSLSNQVVILHKNLGDTSAAMELLEDLEAAASRTGIINVEMQIRGIAQGVREAAASTAPGATENPIFKAKALAAAGDTDGAMRLCRDHARSCQKSGDPDGHRRALELVGDILIHLERYSDAAPVFEELHRIAMGAGDVEAAMHYMGRQIAAIDAETTRGRS